MRILDDESLDRIVYALKEEILETCNHAAARLIVHLPCFSHISSFMAEHLNWLLLTAWIQFKIIYLTYSAPPEFPPAKCRRSALECIGKTWHPLLLLMIQLYLTLEFDGKFN